MPVSQSYKTVNIKPVTGPLQMRSEPDQVPFGGFRRRINWEINDSDKPGRARGFQKLLSNDEYNNQDLHDQLLSLQTYYSDLDPVDSRSETLSEYPPTAAVCNTTLQTRSAGRQPVTMLSEIVSAEGRRKLMAGTQNRLYVLEEELGNWKIISDGYGGTPGTGLPERRWKSPANVGNVCVLTNNFDPPIYYQFNGITTGCSMQSVSEIPDAETVGMTRVGCVYAWRGVVFFGDVTLDGVRYEDMVYWSDKDAPLSLDPAAPGTISDYQRLNSGEKILGFMALNNYMLITTTRGIWQVTFTTDTSSADSPVFYFQNLYSEMATGESCIVYPNTLCSDGTAIYYLGNDDIYKFNLYMSQPERTDWITAATSLIFEGITGVVARLDRNICESHIAWYDPRTRSVYVSWVAEDSTIPERTLQFQTQSRFASELDFGITAAASFTSGPSKTFRQFLLDLCACTTEEVDTYLPADLKTGRYCTEPDIPDCSAVARDIPLYTNKLITVGGIQVEDYNQPTSDPGSFCRQFGTDSINDLCSICKNEKLMVFAHASDDCLKQLGPEVYYREIATLFDTPCGAWDEDGYENLLLSGPIDLGIPDEEKNIRKLEIEFSANLQAVPSEIVLRIGYAPNAVDPNSASGQCAIMWQTLSARDLDCPSDNSESEHKSKGTSPNMTLHWDFWYSGRMIYFELTTTGKGGGHNVSRIGMEMRALPRSTMS